MMSIATYCSYCYGSASRAATSAGSVTIPSGAVIACGGVEGAGTTIGAGRRAVVSGVLALTSPSCSSCLVSSSSSSRLVLADVAVEEEEDEEETAAAAAAAAAADDDDDDEEEEADNNGDEEEVGALETGRTAEELPMGMSLILMWSTSITALSSEE